MITENGTPLPAAATHVDPVLAELQRLHARMDALERKLDASTQGQRAIGELVEEMGPIGREVMKVGTTKLADLEARGYFAFGGELLAIVDRVVTSYSPDDVRQLGENVVRILDTVRAVTQPEVLAIAADASEVVQHPESVEPVGILGMLKAGTDADVQRGLAVALEVLRHVGRSAEAARGTTRPTRTVRAAASTASVARPPVKRASELPPPTCGTSKTNPLSGRLAPRRAKDDAPAAKAAAPAPTAKAGAAEETLADPKAWTREYATSTAAALGVELGPDHWRVIEFARDDFFTNGVSPNIRRITTATGLTTRDVYALFPKAPGKTAARIAGIPKPAGCL